MLPTFLQTFNFRMTTDMSGTGPSAYPIVVLRRLTEDDFASIPDESDENFELERKEVETETRMIITRELIFDRIGEILQEKLEATFNWSSCEEYFNPDRSLVSKNTNLKWPSRLKTLQLLKRKVVIALWNIMKEEKRNVKGKTRLEVAFEIARIFISPKFIKNRFQGQIEMNVSGEITESTNPTESEPFQTEKYDDLTDWEYSDNSEEFGDDRRYGRDTDDSEDEYVTQDDGGTRDDYYNPKFHQEISSQDSEEKYDGPRCTCSKTRCLNLNCACIRRGEYCHQHCQCANCHNKEEFKDLRQLVLDRKVAKEKSLSSKKEKDLHNQILIPDCKCERLVSSIFPLSGMLNT